MGMGSARLLSAQAKVSRRVPLGPDHDLNGHVCCLMRITQQPVIDQAALWVDDISLDISQKAPGVAASLGCLSASLAFYDYQICC